MGDVNAVLNSFGSSMTGPPLVVVEPSTGVVVRRERARDLVILQASQQLEIMPILHISLKRNQTGSGRPRSDRLDGSVPSTAIGSFWRQFFGVIRGHSRTQARRTERPIGHPHVEIGSTQASKPIRTHHFSCCQKQHYTLLCIVDHQQRAQRSARARARINKTVRLGYIHSTSPHTC